MDGRTAIAVAVLVRHGHVLLVHRHPNRRWYPDCWDFVGGHVESDELPEEAVRRECLEELGVVVSDVRSVPFEVRDPGLAVHAFAVRQWTPEPVNVAPEEHDDLR
ncbi:NUDIX hydrolase [Nocardioides sp. CFH 31398]|uniref:NUDIX hydrolase n=1 Tax=Nocardioides sp. CFH 31398 TaxID=2919579 RepID=UPI001F062206|nr:NUDIX domain-containing protein [Nocardioides sp. CFH 31398]MCH1866630.1 NUDIX domain-containing protein [Nocardioides sp. CFH 31398]